MNLKTSLFDKSIVKSDFKRYWWVMAVFMLMLALFVLPDAVKNTAYPKSFADCFFLKTDRGVLSFIFAFAFGGMLFSYLHRGNSASCLHGLPIKRGTQYNSHILSGVILLIVPIIISSIVIFIECVCLNSGEIFALKFALKYFYTCSVYAVTTLLVTVFASMLSGNTIASYVFAGGFIVLPFAIETICNYVLEANLYGFTASSYTAISGKLYIYGIDKMCSSKSLVYIVMLVVLFFVNKWLYKIRSIESYEEIIAFKVLRPIFMYAVAVFFGLLGWVMLNSMFEFKNLFLGTMPLGILALVAAFMLNRKSFGIKGLLKPLIIFVLGMGILQLCFVFDITGYERRVPDISKVVSVEPYEDVGIYSGYINNSYTDGVYYEDIGYKGVLTDEKDIDNILKFHNAIVDNRKLNKSDIKSGSERVTFKYNLDNGKILERSYVLDSNLYSDYFKSYYENDVYKKVAYPILNDNEKKINYVQYNGFDREDSVRLRFIDYDKLNEALKNDIMALGYNEIKDINIYGYGRGRSITINCDEVVEYQGKELKFERELDIGLNGNFKNTNQLIDSYLASHGDNIINPENINYLDIYFNSLYQDDNGAEAESEYQNTTVKDEKDILELYNFFTNLYKTTPDFENGAVSASVNVYIGDNLVSGYSFNIAKDEIPEALMKYLK